MKLKNIRVGLIDNSLGQKPKCMKLERTLTDGPIFALIRHLLPLLQRVYITSCRNCKIFAVNVVSIQDDIELWFANLKCQKPCSDRIVFEIMMPSTAANVFICNVLYVQSGICEVIT